MVMAISLGTLIGAVSGFYGGLIGVTPDAPHRSIPILTPTAPISIGDLSVW